jgi:hypothetical protein
VQHRQDSYHKKMQYLYLKNMSYKRSSWIKLNHLRKSKSWLEGYCIAWDQLSGYYDNSWLLLKNYMHQFFDSPCIINLHRRISIRYYSSLNSSLAHFPLWMTMKSYTTTCLSMIKMLDDGIIECKESSRTNSKEISKFEELKNFYPYS